MIQCGEKCWYKVSRYLCVGRCKKTFTALLPNMLENKHYCASEIEGALYGLEEGLSVNDLKISAEESTIRRWKREFKTVIPALSSKLEALAQIFFQRTASLSSATLNPLKRLENALGLLETPCTGWPILARAFFRALSHPLCIG